MCEVCSNFSVIKGQFVEYHPYSPNHFKPIASKYCRNCGRDLYNVYSGVYKHYKGEMYTVLSVDVLHTESNEKLVIYTDKNNNMYARPQDMFFETLEDGQYRFEKIN